MTISMPRLLNHSGKRCPYCLRTMTVGSRDAFPTRDHVVPLSKGGCAIVIVCSRCNNEKANLMPDQFLKRRQGCARTRARLAIIGALRKTLNDPSLLQLPLTRQKAPKRSLAPEPFSTTTMADAFARWRAKET